MWILRNKRNNPRPNLPLSNDTRALRVSARKCLLVHCTLILGARQVAAERQSQFAKIHTDKKKPVATKTRRRGQISRRDQ